MKNIYQIIVINIFLILTFASGIIFRPQMYFDATMQKGYYKLTFVEFDFYRCLIVFSMLTSIYVIIELSIYFSKKEGKK